MISSVPLFCLHVVSSDWLHENSRILAGVTCDYRYSPTLFCATCVCPPPQPSPHASRLATKKKKSEKKRQMTTMIKTNNAITHENKTDERKRRKVMTTLSDMVMQCGGGGCCVLEQCFQYPRRAREPRDCGCQFALLHRADIAWPSVHVLTSQFYLLVALPIYAGEKPRLYRGSPPCLSTTVSLSPSHIYFFCVCVTYPISLSVYLLVSLLNPHSYFIILASNGKNYDLFNH